MSPESIDEKAVFNIARQIDSREARADYLRQVCGADPDALRRVVELLQVHEQERSFLESPAVAVQATTDQPPLERPGTQIGPYKLLQQIGEGGMGTVYMAEQSHPVQRKVALKVIKPGMDSGQVIARFEAERQALALMDHPNIAKVLDAGTTAAGRPYFVMELVHGVPITNYCDENHLPPKARLELFTQVCQAVQHAHHKGVIHRDLKPTNVLVTLYDDKPVPKVIDFGVAKATGGRLTERTMFTGYGQIVGTIEYMSPEQARLNALDIDTRGDVYSLGVLLYELLTGTTPFDKKRLHEAAFDEMLRMIREEEPPKPSTRLSTSEGLASIAANRSMEPKKLSGLVRGELDWIVMKALEKDRNRRYETANGFAQDVQRYLADEPVLACPPSATYRFRKFARRNRAALIAATALALVFLVGVAGLAVSNRLIARERDAKDTALVTARKAEAKEARERRKAQRQSIETERQRKLAEENYQTAREAVDRMLTRAAEDLRDKPQMDTIRRELLEEALKFYQRFLKQRGKNPTVFYETAMSHRRVGEIQGYLGDPKKSLEHHVQSIEMLRKLCERSASNRRYRDQLARALFHSATASFTMVRLKEGDATMNEAIAIWEALAKDSPNQGPILENLAWAYAKLGRSWSANYYAKGQQFTARSQQFLAQLGQKFPKHQVNASFKKDLEQIDLWRFAALPHDPALLEQLELECRERLAVAEREAAAHPDVPDYMKTVERWIARLSASLCARDQWHELEELCRRNVDINTRLVNQYPHVDEYRVGLGWAEYRLGQHLFRTGRNQEATGHFRTAITTAAALLDKHPDVIRYHSHLQGMIVLCPIHEFRDLPRAVELVKRMVELSGGGWSNLAFAEVRAGRYTEALESARKAAAAKEDPALVAITEAIAAWHSGKQEEARQRVRQVVLELDTVPNNYWYELEYRLLRGEIEQMMGIEPLKSADAEEILRESISLFEKRAADLPTEPWHREQAALRWRDLGETLAKTSRTQEAEQAFRRALNVAEKLAADFPNDRGYRLSMGQNLYALADLLRGTGQLQDAEKSARQATTLFEKLAAEFPATSEYRHELANIYHHMLADLLNTLGRPEEAKKANRQALAIWEQLAAESPSEFGYQINLGWVHFALGQSDKAIAALNKAIELKPESSGAWQSRGDAHAALAQWDKALADYWKAIELNPAACAGLTDQLKANGRVQEAEQLIRHELLKIEDKSLPK